MSTSYGVRFRAFAARRSIVCHRCSNVSICLRDRLAALDDGSKKYVDGKEEALDAAALQERH